MSNWAPVPLSVSEGPVGDAWLPKVIASDWAGVRREPGSTVYA